MTYYLFKSQELKLRSISMIVLLLPLICSTAITTIGGDRRQIWVETQNADDPQNTLDIIYYSDRTCEISYRAMGRSQLGWVCDNTTHQGGGCIYRTYLCDGVVNCQNAQDEDPIFCATRQCEADKGEDFRCPSGRCLPSALRCNSRPDCPIADGKHERLAYDELFCPCTITLANIRRRDRDNNNNNRNGGDLEEGGYWCRAGRYSGHRQCLAKSAWCDGRRDCEDGEDENPTVCAAKGQILLAAASSSNNNYHSSTTTSSSVAAILRTTIGTNNNHRQKQTTPAAKQSLETTHHPIVVTSARQTTTTHRRTNKMLMTTTTTTTTAMPSSSRQLPAAHRSSTGIGGLITRQQNNQTRSAVVFTSSSSSSTTTTTTTTSTSLKKETESVTTMTPTSTTFWPSPSPSPPVLPAVMPTSPASQSIIQQLTNITPSLSDSPDNMQFSTRRVAPKIIKTTATPFTPTKTPNSLFETLSSSADFANSDSDGFSLTTADLYYNNNNDDEDGDKGASLSSVLTSQESSSEGQQNSEEVTQSSLSALDHPGGNQRQREEDMVVYIAIGTIAAAVFVGGLIFLIILNVKRSAAMAARKEKQIGGNGYSTIPTSAIFSKQTAIENKTPVSNNSVQRNVASKPSCESSVNRRSGINCDGSNDENNKTDQTDMAVRQPLLDSSNSEAAPISTTAKL